MYLKQSNRLGIFFVFWFVLCVIWFYIQPVDRILYLQLFRLSFFDFTGMNAFSIIFGAIQSYIFGYLVVAMWMLASKIAGFKK